MSEGPVRWGILGAAKIAREWLCPAIHMSAEGEVAAVASRSDKGAALAKPYGARLHGSYEALLGDPEIDAIYIPLPNGMHVEWTEKCLRAGKHVLCEKPIALKAAEIDGLIAARDAAGRVAAEAFMVVHHPQWARVQEILASGEIGELRQVQGAFSFFNDDPANIRNRPEDGGGALRDIGVYPSVTTRFATGKEPVAIRSRIDWENGIDATARVSADFEGFALDFYVSMRMERRQEMVFHGSKGWVRVRTPFNAKLYGDDVLEIRGAGDVTRLERFPLVDHYRVQVDAFNASVLRGAEYPCSLEFSKGNQRMIDMIYAGAE
jgi:predicted dehydrogenase